MKKAKLKKSQAGTTGADVLANEVLVPMAFPDRQACAKILAILAAFDEPAREQIVHIVQVNLDQERLPFSASPEYRLV